MNQKPQVTDPTDPTDQPLRIPPVASPRHQEALLDQAVAETFPASDPISPAVAERLEPGDVRHAAGISAGPSQRNSAMWIALGVAAVAWLAMRALRGGRSSDR